MLLYVRVLVSCNNIKHPAQLAQWKKPLGVMHTVKRIHSQLVFFALNFGKNDTNFLEEIHSAAAR